MDPWNWSIEDEEASQAYLSFKFRRIFFEGLLLQERRRENLKKTTANTHEPRRGAYRLFFLLAKHHAYQRTEKKEEKKLSHVGQYAGMHGEEGVVTFFKYFNGFVLIHYNYLCNMTRGINSGSDDTC